MLRWLKKIFNYHRIPRGDYCYKIVKIQYPKDDQDVNYPIIITKTCPFYIFDPSGSSKCSLMNVDNDLLLDDQVKCCNIKID